MQIFIVIIGISRWIYGKRRKGIEDEVKAQVKYKLI